MQQTIEHADRHAGAHRAAEPARRRLTALAPSRESCLVPSLAELVLTVMLFVVLWVLMLAEPPSFLFRGFLMPTDVLRSRSKSLQRSDRPLA